MRITLVSSHFPYLLVHIQVHKQIRDVDALIDTGFDGFVAMPRETLMNGDPPDGYIPCTLADASKIAAPFYRGIVRIGKFPSFAAIILALGDEPLVGRGVTDKFKVIFDYGKKIIVEL